MGYAEIVRQAQLFALAVLMGAALLFIYDLLRMFRRIVKHRVIGIAVQDIMFWMFCALWLFAFMYRQNDGIIRGFLIFGAFCGMCFYSLLLSRRIVKGGTLALRCVFRVTGRFFHIISAPLRFLSGILRRYIRKTRQQNKKSARYLKKRLKKIGKAVKIGVSKL